jgi:NADPH:quinone reductase-like Zn-dependent oxidoreductase
MNEERKRTWLATPKPQFLPGHEAVGNVVAVGTGVSHVGEGDCVGVPVARDSLTKPRLKFDAFLTLSGSGGPTIAPTHL